MSQAVSLTPLAVAALALLAEKPMHPYEMYQTLNQSFQGCSLNVKPGSLYHTVARLVRCDYVRAVCTDREGKRPERTTYEITESGRAGLSAQVSSMLAEPVDEYPQFFIAIGEANNLPADEVLDLLRDRVAALTERKNMLEKNILAAKKLGIERRLWLGLEFSHSSAESEICWVTRIIDELESGVLPWSSDMGELEARFAT